jgi:hypothetical protein
MILILVTFAVAKELELQVWLLTPHLASYTRFAPMNRIAELAYPITHYSCPGRRF